MKARETIAGEFQSYFEQIEESVGMVIANRFADRVIQSLNRIGYEIVPSEPSEKMIRAGAEFSWYGAMNTQDPGDSKQDNAADVYRAMLNAAKE